MIRRNARKFTPLQAKFLTFGPIATFVAGEAPLITLMPATWTGHVPGGTIQISINNVAHSNAALGLGLTEIGVGNLNTLAAGTYTIKGEIVSFIEGFRVLDTATTTLTVTAPVVSGLKPITATTTKDTIPVPIPAGAVAGDLVMAIATNRASPQTPWTMVAPTLDERVVLANYAGGGSGYQPGITVWIGKLPAPLPSSISFGADATGGLSQQALVLVEGRGSFIASTGTGSYASNITFSPAATNTANSTGFAIVASFNPDIGVTVNPSGYTTLVDEEAATWAALTVLVDEGLNSPINPGNATLSGSNNWSSLIIGCVPGGVAPPPPPPPDPTPETGINYGKPAAPNLSTVGAVLVSNWSQLVSAVANNPTNTAFLLAANTTFTATSTIQPKQGQRFLGQTGTIVNGGGSMARAFKGPNHDVTIANIRFTNFRGGGTAVERVSVIDAKQEEWTQGSVAVAHDWRIHKCSLDNNANCAIILGHRFIVDECTMEGHSPCAITSGYATGGTIYKNTFKDNGYAGGAGVGENNSTIKLIWHNVGPWGQTAHDTSRFKLFGGVTNFGNLNHNYETPVPIVIANNTFIGARNTAVYGAGVGSRGIWFDLDCRNADVAYNTFNDQYAWGVFCEGSNGIDIHHNTFNNYTSGLMSSAGFSNTGGMWSTVYYSTAAVAAGSSSNIAVKDNIFNNCSGGCVINFHSARDLGDWGTPHPSGWPLATATYNFMIRASYTPIARGHASSIGSSNIEITGNTLNGTSRCIAHAYYSGGTRFNSTNRATNANHSTHIIQGNTYAGSDFRNFWNGTRYDSLSAWRAATPFDD